MFGPRKVFIKLLNAYLRAMYICFIFNGRLIMSVIPEWLHDSLAWSGNSSECLWPISTSNNGSCLMSSSCSCEGQPWRGLCTYLQAMSGWVALHTNAGMASYMPPPDWPAGPLISRPSGECNRLSVSLMCSQSTPSDLWTHPTSSWPTSSISAIMSACVSVTSILQ